MTTYVIPTIAAAQRFSVSLAGVVYVLQLTWNDVAGMWLLDMLLEDSTPVLLGLHVVANSDLLAPFTHLNLGGQLIAQTEGNENEPPTFDNLGGAGRIYFVTS